MALLRSFVLSALLGLSLSCAAPAAFAVLIVGDQLSNLQLYDETTHLPIPGTVFNDPNLGLPSSIAIGPDQNIYVSSNSNGNVVRFNGQTFASMGVYASYAGGAAGTLRFSPGGELYVADTANGNIHRYQGPGDVSPGAYIDDVLITPISSNFAMSFVFDPSSNDLIVVNDPLPFVPIAEMYRVNPAGVATPIGTPGIGGLTSASSMLVGPSGELYVVDIFGNQLVRFDDLNGTNPTQFISFTDPAPVATGSNYPTGILLDENGNLLISLAGQYNLGDPEGNPPEGALRIYSILDGSELPGAVTGLLPLYSIASFNPALESNNPAPEPSAGLLTLMGALGLAKYRRRRR